MKLAVVSTAANPFQLTIFADGVHRSTPRLATLTDAFRLSLTELRSTLSDSVGQAVTGKVVAPIASEIELWGAGVTYLRSRDARAEESDVPDVYGRVYEADRPELFYKSSARRVRGPGASIGIRYDARASVPEPEVAIFVNRYKEIIGYSICNDVTARSIEGENPLYLSQAKIYVGSVSLGPNITPAWLAKTPDEMTISARILRGGEILWKAQTSLGQLNRKLVDLVDYLFRCQDFPDGVILSTGTGIIPPLDVALAAGDIVEISVAGIGTLSNPVVVIPESPNGAF
jgi:2-dehydro-3-deoxy-D-arabinonate dehydratase